MIKEFTDEDYDLFDSLMSDIDATENSDGRKQKSAPKKEGRKIEYKVTEPISLLDFLFGVLPDKSKTTVKSYLKHRQVSVENVTTTQFDKPLKRGECVTLNTAQMEATLVHTMLRVIYEDDYLIVAYKRNGLLSMASDSERKKTAYYILSEYLKAKDKNNRVFIVHRLDRETSGLMLFAKSADIQHQLQQNWNEIVLERKYVAVIEGQPKSDSGEITSYLAENKAFTVYSTHDAERGEKATTHYKVLRKGNGNTLVELELETGKKNQIRVHMKDMYCPIVGDKKYGGHTSIINRVALHARQIRFIHPVTHEELNFETPIPKPFMKLL
ncbi:MAG: RluA family pseudouridine synthase [Rikenellaceae bacterium]